jgi:hypothetical protein
MTVSTALARAFHAASNGSDPMNNVHGCELVLVATLMIVIGSKK